MNVKVKFSIEQFKWLLNWVHNFVQLHTTDLSEVQLINLKCFTAKGFKKLIDLNSELQFTPTKIKTFSIEFNQYHTVLNCLDAHYDNLDAYTVSIAETMRAGNKLKLITFK